ncbi:D-3-phosphoglycerate dehydrogenase 1, chloroplastic [Porphyridium purpureum]|uniref:D-3-phosphoglycerate dehydrogenase n=1 Tax=Porphyridium purpureum TaxID=35688 RepID=A0A5J4YVP5_PORPP|nr:D-3-phosphoglycerate dehydrogenase 1, chloroplastic [Porphyridium purpureum]|eukprot:POR2154..scf227_4
MVEQDANGVPATVATRGKVLVPEKLSKDGLEILQRAHDVHVDLSLDASGLLSVIGEYDALIVRSATQVTREVLEAGKKLKVIGRAGVGVDNIDLGAASERGVMVVNAPTGNCLAAAEHAVALMCAMSRHIPAADASMKRGEWSRGKYVGVSLAHKTISIIGFGRIGREVAKRARGLGMNVVAYDPFVSVEAGALVGVTILELDDALAAGDFITLHMPLLDSTKNLLNRERLQLVKPTARIINAARGGIIEEEALLDALNSGALAGAALDCFSNEPTNKHPESVSMKLAVHPNVVATPHLGASTEEAQFDVAIEISESVVIALNGGFAPTLVNAPAMRDDQLKKVMPRARLAERLAKLAMVLNRTEHREVSSVSLEFHLRDELEDTRMIKAFAIRGLLQDSSEIPINIVNAEKVAKSRNLVVQESKVPVGHDEDQYITVCVGSGHKIRGRTMGGLPHVTRIGVFETDLRLEGTLLVYIQEDRPGQLGRSGKILGDANVNVSNMTIGRHRDSDYSLAMVLLGVDSTPDAATLKALKESVCPEYTPVVVSFN